MCWRPKLSIFFLTVFTIGLSLARFFGGPSKFRGGKGLNTRNPPWVHHWSRTDRSDKRTGLSLSVLHSYINAFFLLVYTQIYNTVYNRQYTSAQAYYCTPRLNLLAPEFFFLILAHPVYKMWIIQEPKQVSIMKQTAFWREKNGEYRACLKYSVHIFVE